MYGVNMKKQADMEALKKALLAKKSGAEISAELGISQHDQSIYAKAWGIPRPQGRPRKGKK
jgi:hypothetical protein